MRRWFARSLVGRVALASALAAALGGTVAALSMGVTAKELVSKHENKSVRSAARSLAREVLDELADDGDDEDEQPRGKKKSRALPAPPRGGDLALERALMHELEDVKLPGARASVHLHDQLIAGDARVPRLTPGDCALTLFEGNEARACSVVMDTQVLTLLTPTDAERDRNVLISRALVVGLTLGALLGGLASFFLARWALSPLTALRDRVRALRVDDAQPAQLGPEAAQRELEELRAAIAHLVARLSSALREAQAFAGEAAHELRTPLTTIAGELELYAEGERDPAALARVRTQVAGLTALVQRLLVLAQPSRLDAREAELVDLSDVVVAALDTLAPEARARVHVAVADDVVVRGDAALLRALLLNGVQNALKFSADEVRVDIAEVAGSACIDVRDRGPGIAPADRERVFTPFYRAASVRAQGTGGHGIGLSLIARVAWRHGGSAAFIEADDGAHLRVLIPMWHTDQA
ncbi:MAG: HAMP domain-containing sensor histidine kinase [Polyangiales bacterium]